MPASPPVSLLKLSHTDHLWWHTALDQWERSVEQACALIGRAWPHFRALSSHVWKTHAASYCGSESDHATWQASPILSLFQSCRKIVASPLLSLFHSCIKVVSKFWPSPLLLLFLLRWLCGKGKDFAYETEGKYLSFSPSQGFFFSKNIFCLFSHAEGAFVRRETRAKIKVRYWEFKSTLLSLFSQHNKM